MKLQTNSYLFCKGITNSAMLLLFAVIIIAVSSCAKKINFQTSAMEPAARGTVKVKKDENNNYSIKIELLNLAEAKRLPVTQQTYVVWMESAEQAVKNLGQLNSGRSMLSKKLKATFSTVSSVKPVKIFITAENDATVQYPGSVLVLTTSSF